MPMLIKSANGKRTCILTAKDNSSKEAFTPDDIIAALRGLTLKVEMKIVDVIAPEAIQEASAVHGANGYTSGPISVPKEPEIKHGPTPAPANFLPGAPGAPATPVALPKLAEPTTLRDNLIPPQVLRAKILEYQSAEPPSQPKQPVKIPAVTATVEKSDKPEVHSAKVESMTIDSEMTKLIKGGLKVGSHINTYCLAVEPADPPIVYVPYDNDKIHRISEMISELAHDIEQLPQVGTPKVGDIVFGKSNEDNSWYRAMVESIEGGQANVFFFDWGLREKLPNERIKRLTYQELGLSECPACAIKLAFKDSKQEFIEEILTCEVIFEARVDSYNFATECYEVAILKTDTPA